MTTSKVLQVLTFLLAISTFAVAARAGILYASYDPSNLSVSFPTKVEAQTFGTAQNIYGAEFSPTLAGHVGSLTAAIAVNFIGGGGPGPTTNEATYQFDLFAGNTVDPFTATPIDTFSKVVNTPGDTITSITFASTLNPMLTVGTNYWIYMGTSPGGAQPLDWGVPSSTGKLGTIDDASSSMGGATIHSYVEQHNPACFRHKRRRPRAWLQHSGWLQHRSLRHAPGQGYVAGMRERASRISSV